MFSIRLQSSYIREYLELGSNLLYVHVVLIIISNVIRRVQSADDRPTIARRSVDDILSKSRRQTEAGYRPSFGR